MVRDTSNSVAVLFVEPDSIYKTLPGCDCYDAERDALTWAGGCHVVAHPPCRLWGRMRQFSIAPPDEAELARWSVDQVREWGGVLEHPAASRLWWDGKGLAFPNGREVDDFGGFALSVDQHWWGHRAQKKTWLYVCGCKRSDVPAIPLTMSDPTHVIRPRAAHPRKPSVTKRERQSTPPEFAEWLVELARACTTTTRRATDGV